MRRREFITLLGGAATTWPLGALGQDTAPVVVLSTMPDMAAESEQKIGEVGAAARLR